MPLQGRLLRLGLDSRNRWTIFALGTAAQASYSAVYLGLPVLAPALRRRARSGAALGFQQTAIAVAGAATPPVFASIVEGGSWALGFGLAALLPLAGIGLMRRLSV